MLPYTNLCRFRQVYSDKFEKIQTNLDQFRQFQKILNKSRPIWTSLEQVQTSVIKKGQFGYVVTNFGHV